MLENYEDNSQGSVDQEEVAAIEATASQPLHEVRSHIPPFIYLIRFLRVERNHLWLHGEPTKKKIRSAAIRLLHANMPSISRGTIIKLARRYWRWEKRTYTPREKHTYAREEQKWLKYQEEFCQFVRTLGISLEDFDKAAEATGLFDEGRLRDFFIGCYLVAVDRAPSFVIHRTYKLIVDKAMVIFYEAWRSSCPSPIEERLAHLGDPNPVKDKLFDVLFEGENDTAGQASVIIQVMLYMRDNPDKWIPYLVELEGKEIISMIQRILDALLEIILGEDKMPMESVGLQY